MSAFIIFVIEYAAADSRQARLQFCLCRVSRCYLAKPEAPELQLRNGLSEQIIYFLFHGQGISLLSPSCSNCGLPDALQNSIQPKPVFAISLLYCFRHRRMWPPHGCHIRS